MFPLLTVARPSSRELHSLTVQIHANSSLKILKEKFLMVQSYRAPVLLSVFLLVPSHPRGSLGALGDSRAAGERILSIQLPRNDLPALPSSHFLPMRTSTPRQE